MPKQLYKITQFHGGLSSNSDARDIAEQELSDATDIMVDELGKIRMMGGTTTHDAPAAATVTGITGTIVNGYGLFYFAHDRTGGENSSKFSTGVHDGSDNQDGSASNPMVDSGESWVADALIDGTIYNETDGSSAIITDNTDNDIIHSSALTGGDNDWDTNDTFRISMPQTRDDYLAFYDAADGDIWIYSRVRDAWDDDYANDDRGAISQLWTSNVGTAKPVFYYIDGAIRICDANFDNSNANIWYAYVTRTHFPGLSVSQKFFEGWYDRTNEIEAPTQGIVGAIRGTNPDNTSSNTILYMWLDPSSGGSDPWLSSLNSKGNNITSNAAAHVQVLNKEKHTIEDVSAIAVSDSRVTTDPLPDSAVWDAHAFCLIPQTVGAGFFLHTQFADGGAYGAAGTMTSASTVFEFAETFLYDAEPEEPNVQESPLYIMDNTVTLATLRKLGLCTVICRTPYRGRITGGRIYARDLAKQGDWYEIITISLNQGIKSNIESAYTVWALDDDNNVNTKVVVTASVDVSTLGFRTYQAQTGLAANEVSSEARFKTAVIANRVAYLGNVLLDGKRYPDGIFQSVPNKFDAFSTSKQLAASINDGDEIVKLEYYADRILQFKKNKMQIINISQYGSEFLEETLMHKGVSHTAATCKTDFGIAWVNNFGCYLFDGQRVNNLLEKKGRQIIKESEWATFTANEPMIGYIPKKRQIIVADDITTNGDGSSYLYDMVTQSWVKGAAGTIDDQVKTNFVTDWNGDLVYIHTDSTGSVVKWDDAGDDSTAFVMQTKDIDFGQPAQKKKIYKVYVTYTGVSSLSVDVDYQINGDNGWNGFASGEPLTASSAQNEATLTLSSPVECYSFQLRFSGTGKTTFEINDVTIVFRLKGMR